LSLQIKDLEREVGAALFHRVPHGAELTAAGEAFLEAVKGMPALAQQGVRLALRAARGEIGALRVGFTASSALNAVVPGTLRAFRRAYPAVTLLLEEANTSRLIAGLQDGTLDVAFLRLEPGAGRDLTLRVLSEEPMLVVLPSSHPAASDKEVDLGRLVNDPFILHPRASGPTLYDTIIGACRGAGFEPRVDQVAPQLSSIISLVAAELGVALVPASMQQLRVAGVTFKPIKGSVPATSLALAFRKNSTSRIVRNFMAAALSA
jgi:DNA-binding transcriptional LysR family regulator